MKYAAISNSREDFNNDSVGFYQWNQVFGGTFYSKEEYFSIPDDTAFDLIHIRINPENLELIKRVSDMIKGKTDTKLVLTLDIPVNRWDNEFKNRDMLKQAAEAAHFIFCNEYSLSKELEDLTGKNIYLIPHPVDIGKINSYPKVPGSKYALIMYDGDLQAAGDMARVYKEMGLKSKLLTYRYPIKIDAGYLENIELVQCEGDAELISEISACEFVFLPGDLSYYGNQYHNFENLLQYCAVLGCMVMGSNKTHIMRKCYSELASIDRKEHLRYYGWVNDNPYKKDYDRERAAHITQNFNFGNSFKKFVDLLYLETKDPRFQYRQLKASYPIVKESFAEQIELVSGPNLDAIREDEFAVVCLIKNGADYVASFVEHYRRLGAAQIIFIDNGSTDNTMDLILSYKDVKLYRTGLSFRYYESEIRRTVIEENCRNCWCLSVDSDELFDYPCSNKISMKDLLIYLNRNRYTALMAYLLDMFSNPKDKKRSAMKMTAKYCYYNISGIRKVDYNYFSYPFVSGNVLSDKAMKGYIGGVRANVFKNKEIDYFLTKHPLVFINGKTEAVSNPHYCNNVFVADLQGVLKHYKFIDTFGERLKKTFKQKETYEFYAETEYESYLKKLKETATISLYSFGAKKLSSVDDLIKRKFLKVSTAYMQYVKKAGSKQ